MATSLWPDFPTDVKPRGVRQMLEDAGGDIAEKTHGVVQFRVRTYSEGDKFYHDCYLLVPRVGFQHLLVRVTTGVTPFPAAVFTPSGEGFGDVGNENNLRSVLRQLFQRRETREVVENLIANFGEHAQAVSDPAGGVQS
jgi:hypothetical protein